MSAVLAARMGDSVGSHGSHALANALLVAGLIVGAALAVGLVIMTGGLAAPLLAGGLMAATAGGLLVGSAVVGGVALTAAAGSAGEKLGESYDHDHAKSGGSNGGKGGDSGGSKSSSGGCSNIKKGYPTVTIEKQLAARITDDVNHADSHMKEGSKTISIGKQPASRQDDASKCGGIVVSFAQHTFLGGPKTSSEQDDDDGAAHRIAQGLDKVADWGGKIALGLAAAAAGVAVAAGATVLGLMLGAGMAVGYGLSKVGGWVGQKAGGLVDSALGYQDHRWAQFSGTAGAIGAGFLAGKVMEPVVSRLGAPAAPEAPPPEPAPQVPAAGGAAPGGGPAPGQTTLTFDGGEGQGGGTTLDTLNTMTSAHMAQEHGTPNTNFAANDYFASANDPEHPNAVNFKTEGQGEISFTNSSGKTYVGRWVNGGPGGKMSLEFPPDIAGDPEWPALQRSLSQQTEFFASGVKWAEPPPPVVTPQCPTCSEPAAAEGFPPPSARAEVTPVVVKLTSPVFRGTFDSPEQIFRDGFVPGGTHNDIALHTKAVPDLQLPPGVINRPGNFVSTTPSQYEAGVAGSGQSGLPVYVYELTPPEGIDVNATFGPKYRWSGEDEIAIQGGVPPEQIKGYWEGDTFHPNPNYQPVVPAECPTCTVGEEVPPASELEATPPTDDVAGPAEPAAPAEPPSAWSQKGSKKQGGGMALNEATSAQARAIQQAVDSGELEIRLLPKDEDSAYGNFEPPAPGEKPYINVQDLGDSPPARRMMAESLYHEAQHYQQWVEAGKPTGEAWNDFIHKNWWWMETDAECAGRGMSRPVTPEMIAAVKEQHTAGYAANEGFEPAPDGYMTSPEVRPGPSPSCPTCSGASAPDPATVERVGQPSGVLTNRSSETPYHAPDNMQVIRPGSPLDFNSLDRSKTYLWVVDGDGNMRVAPEQNPSYKYSGDDDMAGTERPVKHGDLVAPPDGQTRGIARAGGELNYDDDAGNWVLDNQSSYTFNRADGTVSSPDNLAASKDLLQQSGTDVSNLQTNDSIAETRPVFEQIAKSP